VLPTVARFEFGADWAPEVPAAIGAALEAAGVEFIIPIRRNDDGTVEVLVITSRETNRWVIPKGWPMRKRKPSEAAMIEAYEEAGVRGHIIGRRRLGHYHSRKMLPAGCRRGQSQGPCLSHGS
jgi:8-oxo-dGTP pyrophosphatase MutT (NUDIX family)